MYLKTMSFLAAILFVAITAAEARDQIRIVGSSTVFPFSDFAGGRTIASNPTPISQSLPYIGGKWIWGSVG